jgi:RHS repeat-associated protein
MVFVSRFLKSFMISLMLTVAFFGTSASAQTQELRAIPQPEVGLWRTIALGSNGIEWHYAGSADEACRIQHQITNPLATYVGVAPMSEVFMSCTWTRYLDGGPVGSNTTLGQPVNLECPEGYQARRGVCVLRRLPILPMCNADCGSNPVSGTPQINIGNPININSGLKVQNETDFQTADGLFRVDRQYLSRQNIGWQTLIPGYLELGDQFSHVVIYNSRSGGRDQFNATELSNPNGWTFALPNFQGTPQSVSRRRLTMVTIPAVDRSTFRTDTNVSPTGPAEMRLDMANGEYILFRRANGPQTGGVWRRLVPVEHGKPGGYTIWFDYNDAGFNPFRIRDSLNREMLLTWADAAGGIADPGFVGSKVISQIQLPDGTRLDYGYDRTSSSYTTAIPTWAAQLGYNIRGPIPGSIKVVIEGRKDRLRSVTRTSAAGALLWQRQFDYDYRLNPSAMTRARDQTGATLAEYTYTNGELLATSKLAGDISPHKFEHYEVYNNNSLAEGIVRRAINPLGRVDDYWLFRRGSGLAEAVTLTRIAGSATATTPADNRTFEYSASQIFGLNQMMKKSVDQLGRETTYTVDNANRRPTAITEATGTTAARQTVLGWHPIWDLPTRTERGGVRVDTSYTADAMVASQTVTDLTTHTAPYSTNGQSRTINYTWGPNARLLSVNGPKPIDVQGRDDIINFAYDTAGNVTSMTNALGHVTSFAGYDANGRPATMTDPNNVVTQFTYDLLGRVIGINEKHPTTASLDAITTMTYDIEGRVKTITRPASAALTMNYDLAGLLKSIVASGGERIDFAHDAMGNVTSQITKRTNASAARTITSTFDALGRTLTETLGPGRTWSYGYDRVGNVTSITTPKNQSTAQSFDALDRLVSAALPDSGAPSMVYDQRDGVVENNDPLGVKTTFVRNGFGEAIQEYNPDRGTSTYYYNAAGEKTAAIDARGQRIDYVYDILGRLVSATPVANSPITYTWDDATISGNYAKGRLSRVVDATTTIEYRYDHRGNTITKRQRIDADAWLQLSFTYDLADRRTQITYPSGRIVNYTFNTLGRVTQVRTKANASATAWTTVASGMTYEAFGSLTRANYGNGTRMIQSWGNDGRLANRRLERSVDSVRLSSLTYAYDANDNFTAITDTLDATKTRAYQSDAMDRITRVTGDQASGVLAAYRREDYAYDRNGNRTLVERRVLETAATPTQTDTYTRTNNTNRIASIATAAGTFTYGPDARGNQSVEQWPDGTAITVAYDGFGRLARYVVNPATQTMLYNGEDERIRVVTTPAVGLTDTRIYIYDLDHRIVGEYGLGGVVDTRAEYIWTLPEVGASGPTGGDDGLGGYMPLAVVVRTATDLRWVHSHHNGAPILMTSTTGTTVPHADHAVMGFPGQFANAKQLAGAQHYYNRYRDYNPVTGRYIQADPIGLAGDANPYAYAMGNALRYTDPLGLEGVNLFNPNDRASPTANMLVGARGGYFYVAGHGSAGRIVDNRNASRPINYRISDLENLVRMLHRAGLRPGQTIVLASCNMNQESDAFARALAQRTGSIVYATTGFVGYGRNGNSGVVFPREVRDTGLYGSGVWTPSGARAGQSPNIQGVQLNNSGFWGPRANVDYAASRPASKPDWKVPPR